MILITKQIDRTLRANYDANRGEDQIDLKPPLKLFAPWGAAAWLISERDSDEPDQLFGLADLGFGSPELGWISLAEIQSLRGPYGLKIERDMHFTPTKTLTEYAEEARAAGRISA